VKEKELPKELEVTSVSSLRLPLAKPSHVVKPFSMTGKRN
jgi:hypothetical protein